MNKAGNCIVIDTLFNALMVSNSLFLLDSALAAITCGGILMTATGGVNTAIICGCQFQCPVSQANMTAIEIASSNLTAGQTAGFQICNNNFSGFDGTGSSTIKGLNSPYNVLTSNNNFIASNLPTGISGTAFPSNINVSQFNATGAFGFQFINGHGAIGDHGIAVSCGRSGGLSDTGTAILSFGNGDSSATVGSITRNGATGISLNTVNNIAGVNSLAVGTVIQNATTTNNFAVGLYSSGGASGDHGVAIRAGLNTGTDSGTTMIQFGSGNGSVGVGSITRSGTGVAYNTSSDLRLKENIVPTTIDPNLLNQIQIVDHTWTIDPAREVYQGIIAQDLHKIVPRAVNVGGNDPVLWPWGIDYGKLVPLIIHHAQRLEARVKQLESQHG